MIEVNLLPVREARRKADIRHQFMQLALALILTCGALGLFHSRLLDHMEQAQARVRRMESDIEQFKPQLDQVAAFRKKKANLEKKIDVIDGLDRARSGPVHVMDELARRAPKRLWLTELSAKGAQMTMKGESLDNAVVADFLRELDESRYFDEVDLDGTKLGKQSGGLKLVEFSIRAVMVTPGPDTKTEGA